MGAAAVILDGRGYVLLVKHSYGHLNWEIPGGGAEPDESVADTAVRETHEETGLHVAVERLTGVQNPRSAALRQALRGGPIAVELFDVLALEGGTRRADVVRVVEMLDGIEPRVRWEYTA